MNRNSSNIIFKLICIQLRNAHLSVRLFLLAQELSNELCVIFQAEDSKLRGTACLPFLNACREKNSGANLINKPNQHISSLLVLGATMLKKL